MTQSVELPWSKWIDERRQTLRLPETWNVDVVEPVFGRKEPTIDDALRDPVGTQPLRTLAAGARRACIVVEDPARPTRLSGVLRAVLDELIAAGVSADAVTVLVATGAHHWAEPAPIEAKLGLSFGGLAQPRLHLHTPDDCVDSGVSLDRVPVRLNRHFLDSEVRVLIGSVIPHPFASYSGGAKNVLPGIADPESTMYTHKLVRLGIGLTTDPDTNRFRRKIEATVRELEISCCICCVPTAEGEPVGCWAGDLVAAHRKAAELASACYTRQLSGPVDVLILNAYPKDMDLVQSRAALACLPRALDRILRRDGVVVLTTAAPYGARGHGLFSPGGLLHAEPKPEARLAGRELWLYTTAPEEAVRQVFWSRYKVFHSRDQLCDALAERYGERATVAVLPCAPMTRLTSPR